jgi:ribosomal protein S18 acetylase RimI-like enzyme
VHLTPEQTKILEDLIAVIQGTTDGARVDFYNSLWRSVNPTTEDRTMFPTRKKRGKKVQTSLFETRDPTLKEQSSVMRRVLRVRGKGEETDALAVFAVRLKMFPEHLRGMARYMRSLGMEELLPLARAFWNRANAEEGLDIDDSDDAIDRHIDDSKVQIAPPPAMPEIVSEAGQKSHIRWCIRRDMPYIMKIHEQLRTGITEDDFVKKLKGRNAVAMVYEIGDAVLGYMLYDLFGDRIQLQELYVSPRHHGMGIGSALMEKLTSKISEKRTMIELQLPAKHHNVIPFFLRMGFTSRCEIHSDQPVTMECVREPSKSKLKPSVREMMNKDFRDVSETGRAVGDVFTEDQLQEYMNAPDHSMLVAEYDGFTMAYLIYKNVGRRGVEIVRYGVDPKCRRKGLGQSLLTWITDRLDGDQYAYIELTVPPKFAESITFFERFGFSKMRSSDDGTKLSRTWNARALSTEMALRSPIGIAVLRYLYHKNILTAAHIPLWYEPADGYEVRDIERALRMSDQYIAASCTELGTQNLSRITAPKKSTFWKNIVGDGESDVGQRLNAVFEAEAAELDENIAAKERGLRAIQTRLSTVVGAKRHRAQLDHMWKLGNLNAVAAKEVAIAHEIFAVLQSWQYGADAHCGGVIRSCHGGLPVQVLESQSLTCFSGPWVAAAVMRECGIPEHQIFLGTEYETVPQTQTFGVHAFLLLSTAKREIITLDVAGREVGEPFRTGWCENQIMRAELCSLLGNTRRIPVTFRASQKARESNEIFTVAQISPLLEGLASIHCLNVGLSALVLNRSNEAKHAFEVGLDFSPHQPDLHYQLGRLAFAAGDTTEAEYRCRQALATYDKHLLTHDLAARIALELGDTKRARTHFEVIHSDPRTIWGDPVGMMKGMAFAYVRDKTGTNMLERWRRERKSYLTHE